MMLGKRRGGITLSHKWRQQAKKLVGQQVIVRDTNGQMHHGVLQKIQDDGIQIRPMGGAGFASYKKHGVNIEQAIASAQETVDAEESFFGAFLILWVLIAGLWAAGAAGAYGAYGYGPYAYGRPGVYGRRRVYRPGPYGPYRRGPYW